MLEKLKIKIDEHQQLVLKINSLEEELKQLKHQLSDIEEITLPNLLDELDMPTVTFNDGTKISKVERLFTRVIGANKDAAFEWLRENGHGDIIKMYENVHHLTLNSLGQECIENGINLPSELFDQYLKRSVKINHGAK